MYRSQVQVLQGPQPLLYSIILTEKELDSLSNRDVSVTGSNPAKPTLLLTPNRKSSTHSSIEMYRSQVQVRQYPPPYHGPHKKHSTHSSIEMYRSQVQVLQGPQPLLYSIILTEKELDSLSNRDVSVTGSNPAKPTLLLTPNRKSSTHSSIEMYRSQVQVRQYPPPYHGPHKKHSTHSSIEMYRSQVQVLQGPQPLLYSIILTEKELDSLSNRDVSVTGSNPAKPTLLLTPNRKSSTHSSIEMYRSQVQVRQYPPPYHGPHKKHSTHSSIELYRSQAQVLQGPQPLLYSIILTEKARLTRQ